LILFSTLCVSFLFLPVGVLVVRACFALVDGFMDWGVLHVEAWEKGFAFVCAG
jgi:hypothetical protein